MLPPQEQPRTHDTTKRHSLDQRIRRHGFRIHARPGEGEPQWEKGGNVYSEREVLELLECRGK